MRRKRVQNAPLIPCIIDNILIGKQHNIPLGAQQRIVSAKPHTFFLKFITLYPPAVVHILLITKMIGLVHDNRIGLQMHTVCQRHNLLIYRGHQHL